MTIENWNIEAETGYKPMTTFYTDFSIAEKFGINAVKSTFDDIMKNADCLPYKYLTEFVMALNWKCWRWYQHNDALSKLYADCFYKAQEFAYKHLKGEKLEYFISTTD